MTLSTLTTNATVTDVSGAAYTIPTDSPEADGTISWEATTMIVVAARRGEVIGTGWSYGHHAAATVVNDLLSPIVLGRDAFDITGASGVMVNAVRNVGRGGVAGQALSAVDVALWDLKARLLDVPLHRLIGGARDAVPVYGSGGFTTYDHDQLREQLVTWTKELNIPRVKIKIAESWGSRPDRDISRMRQARTIIGDEAELYVDANGGYDRKQAVRVLDAVADLDIRWFEEPVSSDDLAGLRRCARW